MPKAHTARLFFKGTVLALFLLTLSNNFYLAQEPQKAEKKREPPKFLVEPNVKAEPFDEAEYIKKHNRTICKTGEDYRPFINELNNRIYKYRKTKAQETREVHVRFKISRSGEFSDFRVIKSSGDKEFDDKGVEAIKKAAPLPIPDWAPDHIEIQYRLVPEKKYLERVY